MAKHNDGSGGGSLYIVGTGPGAARYLTVAASEALRSAGVIVGYKTYLDLIDAYLPGKEVHSSQMMKEIERCRLAIDEAVAGKTVALVCGGDPGIYAMAGLVFEIARERGCTANIEVIPGIAALNACAALLGAPLMHDFCAVSLSDLLTPWDLIERRLAAAAEADFVVVIYNPRSKRRTDQIVRARELLLARRAPETPVGIVTAATRADETIVLTTLERMLDHPITMQTTVIVGNSNTFLYDGRMVTPRGYSGKYDL